MAKRKAPACASCPTCGRALPKVKAPAASPVEAPSASGLAADGLPEDLTARIAYFKKTAPAEDARFAIRIGAVDAMPADLRDAWQALAEASPTMPRAEVYRRLLRLQETWREWRVIEQRIEAFMDRCQEQVPATVLGLLTGHVEAIDVAPAGELSDDSLLLDVDANGTYILAISAEEAYT